MRRLTTILFFLLCTIAMMGEKHMMFRTLPIDGELKTAVKEVKKWGFMGMKIKNVAALVGTLDGEEVMLTLMATPKTNTLFSVTIMHKTTDQWDKVMEQYQSVNASMTSKYGAPTETISQWEPPYSLDNNPVEGLKNNKAMYGCIYTTSEGKVAVNIIYIEGKLCIIEAYLDKQNTTLFTAEGGENITFDENAAEITID